MRIFKFSVLSRLALLLVAVMTVSVAKAENRLYIENFALSDESPRTVAIMLDNSDAVASLQFNLVMPKGLELVGEPRRNAERFAPGQNMSYAPSKGMFMVTSGSMNSFIGNSGAICYIDVKASKQALDKGENLVIRLENIILSTGNGTKIEADKTVKTEVSLQDGYGVLSANQELLINPGATKRVSVSLDNSFNVQGLQMTVRLPKGFTVKDNVINLTGRCSNGTSATVKLREDGVTYGVVLADYNGNAVINAGKGEMFWFDVVAPADFSAETAEIVLGGLEMSTRENKVIYGTGCTVKIVNGKTALDAANTRIDALQAELDAALAQIAEECPRVADQFPGTELQQSINDLRSKAAAAYEDYTLPSILNEILAEADGISADIAAYLESAKQAEAEVEKQRVENNKALYEADLAKIAALQTALDAAKAEVAEKYAGFADAEAEAAAQAAIDALKAEVEKAYADVKDAGTYSYALNAEPVEAMIAALVTDAANRKKEADRQAANQQAYEADLAKIAALQASLDAAKAEIAEKYADYADAAAEAAAQTAIDALKAEVEKAYADVKDAGNYSYTLKTEPVEAMIAALLADAQNRWAEANREAANKLAYEADLAKIAALQTALDAAKAEVAEKYADYADAEAEAAAQAAIDALKAEVEKAYADVKDAGNYSYTLNAEPVEAMIAALVTDAANRQKEADRKAANKLAYEADLAKIADLQASLDAAKAEIAEKYEGFGDEDEIASIQKSIDALKDTVEKAYAAVATEGVYSCTLQTECLAAAIADLVPNAAEAYRVDFNTKAYNADLDLIADAKKKYDEAIEEIRTKYPEQVNNPLIADVLNQITAAQSACLLEYESVRNEGFYESQVNIETLEKSIKDMLEQIAIAAGVDEIFLDENLEGVEIYTLNGIRHTHPVKGQINILKYKDGTVKKVKVN